MRREYTLEELQNMGFYPDEYEGHDEWPPRNEDCEYYYEEDNFVNENIDWSENLMLCTHEDLIKNVTGKQYDAYSQGCAMGFMDYNGRKEKYKYLYNRDIKNRREELLKEGIKVPSERMLKRDFKILSELGFVELINTPEGLCYKFKQTQEGKYFTVISLYRWKKLMTWTNKHMLRLYIIFSVSCSDNKYRQLSRSYFCEALSIEPTEGNLNYISTQIDGLRRLGVIEVKRVDDIIKLEDGSLHKVTHNKYRLTTDEEFKNK